MVAGTRHDGDSGSTYVAEMFAVCGGVDIMDIDDLGGWLQDDMLSRTTTTSGGGGCNVLRFRQKCDRVWRQATVGERAVGGTSCGYTMKYATNLYEVPWR